LLDWWRLRQYPKPLDYPHTVIYDWRPYRGFHILNLFAGALRIGAIPGESAEDVLRKVPPSADTFLFNLDLSYTPHFPSGRDRLVSGLRARGVDVWNGAVTDIRKRSIQEASCALGLHQVRTGLEGDPAELVIVKSNENCAGRSERSLSNSQREELGCAPPYPAFTDKYSYRVMRRGDVPAGRWQDPRFEIERYIENRRDLCYRVRCLFDHWTVSEMVSHHAVKTRENSASYRHLHFRRGDSVDLPQAMLNVSERMIDRFEIDYGALDVLPGDDGEFYVVDVNTTPGLTWIPEGQVDWFRSAWAERRAEKKAARLSPAAPNVV